MPTTEYVLADLWDVSAIKGKTDAAGVHVADTDWTHLAARIINGVLSPGVLEGLEVAPDVDMDLTVSGGSAVAEGSMPGQGSYVGKLITSVGLTVPAADVSQARVDEVYAVVRDDNYDTSGFGYFALGYRQGDVGGGAPGPDPAWTAYVLLATIDVGDGVTEILAGDITDERVQAGLDEGVGHETVEGLTFDYGPESVEVEYEQIGDAHYGQIISTLLDIPPHWKAWKAFAIARVTLMSPGASDTTVRGRIFHGVVRGGESLIIPLPPPHEQQSQITIKAGQNRSELTVMRLMEGVTATGSYDITLGLAKTDSSATAWQMNIYAQATRTA